jgi:hypothetical protein
MGEREMKEVRVEISHKSGSFTVMVRAESIRQAARTMKALYPNSSVEIVFPIDPDGFFVSEPCHGGYIFPETAEAAGEPGANVVARSQWVTQV